MSKKTLCPICPICQTEEVSAQTRPFCSKRCADVDLHSWLGGKYAIPAVEPPDDFDMQRTAQDADESDDGDSGETH